MKVLLTAIGKRVQLINHLKKNNYVIGVDCGDLAPAIQFVDKFYKIHKYNEKEYIDDLIKICKKEKVDLLIPLYEKEFLILCENRGKFKDVATILLLSNKDIIEICNDKWKTYKFFLDNNINTPISYCKNDIEQLLECEKVKIMQFPFIIKPRDGMGSSNVFKINSIKELEFFKEYVDNYIIQQYVDGIEYTVDVLCDLNGNVISIVPRERIEVRSGEVCKSKAVYDKRIINSTLDLCQKLKGIGPLTIQCILTKNNEIKFIEINPRFGGGVPLSFECGVDYGKFFNMFVEGKEVNPIIGEFEQKTMLRYDEAVIK
ncbi:ATP-grasp domain-containing protein [Clostridium botulinum]|uniref:ATP-grasp domain-containing protein n=1 Tax=unclassified Clostridium TaxID=2614128 RepID=UPI00050423D8|nr:MULTISPECIES: ATP-grasp domain-containing protein [unclassified Clostridium]AIY79498.1 ATP-grasp domain protein [Clostridium botulinum 202F]KAI3348215.1 ATP-grasp domain-containing protein [Clostridium botulinum]KFX54766.1 carbamoyl phosphate synthase-like protein [Clostridium botulinum]KFX58792.1 carbamoyl phosphate synthase-like protein [Clostridium botulinum]KON12952.1 carbamoyl phosphate synthase-like protein [Clostridium botulinum]